MYIKLENKDTGVLSEITPRPTVIEGWYEKKEVKIKKTVNGVIRAYKKKYNPRTLVFRYENVPLELSANAPAIAKNKDNILDMFEEFTDYDMYVYQIPELGVTTEEIFTVTALTIEATPSKIGNSNRLYTIEIEFIERIEE